MIVKKKNFFTGSVFQFYVPEIKKYAFCKFFDFRHLSEFHGLLAQVYNQFSSTDENSLELLRSADWLFGPRSMDSWPDLRKEAGWKSLGILSSPGDNKIPDFKGTRSFPYIVEDETSIGRWYAIRNLSQSVDCEYSRLKHLEMKTLTTKKELIERTGMEYCRIYGLNVADFYDLKAESSRYSYWQMINIPIYSEQPDAIRGTAICV